jgi:sulfate transport system ATP-binding protein
MAGSIVQTSWGWRSFAASIGSPQQVWDHPASPFVYSFLGDVNLFQGRVHAGQLQLDGMTLQAPDHAQAQDARALAYVRPHELHIERDEPGASGMAARLQRARVVGPVARLELRPEVDAGAAQLFEAQMSSERYAQMQLREGERLRLTPRRAGVFLTT